MKPFRIAIADAVIEDLHERLARSRWTDDFANDDWAYGANAAYVREMAGYGRNGYDWRARETAMNALPQFHEEIDGFHRRNERGEQSLQIWALGIEGGQAFGTPARCSGGTHVQAEQLQEPAQLVGHGCPGCDQLRPDAQGCPVDVRC